MSNLNVLFSFSFNFTPRNDFPVHIWIKAEQGT